MIFFHAGLIFFYAGLIKISPMPLFIIQKFVFKIPMTHKKEPVQSDRSTLRKGSKHAKIMIIVDKM